MNTAKQYKTNTWYESQRRVERCWRFEFADCAPEYGRSTIMEEEAAARRWYDWFVSCGLCTAIEMRPFTTTHGVSSHKFVVWREGPRMMMRKQKPADQVIVGELIAVYDPKGIFDD